MAEMRLYEKYIIEKLANFSYVWDSSRNTLMIPSSTTLRAGITTGGNTTGLDVTTSIQPEKTDTVVTAILPRNYRFNTILDGVVFGNVKIILTADTGYDGAPVTSTIYVTIVARLKSITAAGVSTIHKTYTIVTNHSVQNAGGYPSAVSTTTEFPFWFDLDNIHIPATEKILWELTFSGSRATSQGAAGGSAAAYHTISTDEMFVELPIVP